MMRCAKADIRHVTVLYEYENEVEKVKHDQLQCEPHHCLYPRNAVHRDIPQPSQNVTMSKSGPKSPQLTMWVSSQAICQIPLLCCHRLAGLSLRDCRASVTCRPLHTSISQSSCSMAEHFGLLFASSSLLIVENLVLSWLKRSSTTAANSPELSPPAFVGCHES